MNQTHNGPDQRALECGSLLPPWLSPIRDRELQKIDPAVVDQSESVVCQFSCVKRAILLGRRPSVLPAQGNALGTGVAKIELRPNGPTVRLRRGWAVGPSNQGRLVPFPRALPWAGRTAPLRGGGGLGGGTELGCRCQEHLSNAPKPNRILPQRAARACGLLGAAKAAASCLGLRQSAIANKEP